MGADIVDDVINNCTNAAILAGTRIYTSCLLAKPIQLVVLQQCPLSDPRSDDGIPGADIVDDATNNPTKGTVLAGTHIYITCAFWAIADLNQESAYGLMGTGPESPHKVISDYYQIDFVRTCTLKVVQIAN